MMLSERQELCRRVEITRAELKSAEKNYESALRLAYKGGVSYTALAVASEVSEAAIRLRFKRRGWIDD